MTDAKLNIEIAFEFLFCAVISRHDVHRRGKDILGAIAQEDDITVIVRQMFPFVVSFDSQQEVRKVVCIVQEVLM
jgi:hypothetical protein